MLGFGAGGVSTRVGLTLELFSSDTRPCTVIAIDYMQR